MRRLGAMTEIELLRHGFCPAGGGEVRASVAPARPTPLRLDARDALRGMRAEAIVAALPGSPARRELDVVARAFAGLDMHIRELPQREGPGNALLVEVAREHLTELFTGFGERGVAAETVANRVVRSLLAYLASGAALGEHLADQLVLPLALAGGGRFTTCAHSAHLATNLAVIERFLPVHARVAAAAGGWTVTMDVWFGSRCTACTALGGVQ